MYKLTEVVEGSVGKDKAEDGVEVEDEDEVVVQDEVGVEDEVGDKVLDEVEDLKGGPRGIQIVYITITCPLVS